MKKSPPVGVLAIVMRQLADALAAGVSLADTLAILDRDRDLPKRHRDFIADLNAQAARHGGLAQTLADYHDTMPPESVALVRSAEEEGRLAGALDFVAGDLEMRQIHRRGLRGALNWPLAILGVLALILAVILIFVIPAFKEMYTSFGADLPGLTLLVIDMSAIAVDYWWIAALLIAAWVALAKAGVLRLRRVAFLDELTMQVPFIRAYVMKVFVARLSYVLARAAEGRLPVASAVAYLRATAGNLTLARIVAAIESRIAGGEDLVAAVRATQEVPGQLAVALELGLRSNNAGAALKQVLAISESEAGRSLVRLQQAMMAGFYVGAGIIVGAMVIAMYLPIFKLGAAI